MKKGEHIKHYTADQLKAQCGQRRTDWHQADAMTDVELERLIVRIG